MQVRLSIAAHWRRRRRETGLHPGRLHRRTPHPWQMGVQDVHDLGTGAGAGQDHAILARRHALYQVARAQHPARWSGNTRNWQPIGSVWLNPEKEISITQDQKVLKAA